MDPYEMEQLKASQARAYDNANLCGQAVKGIGYANQAMATDECAKEEPLIYRLTRRRMNSNRENQKLDRILDILNRHPEFQEFLEVLQSGLI